MKKIFNDAKDKNVAAVVLYANSSNALFYDAACTKAFNATTDGLDAFVKGCVAIKGGNYYKPTSCTSAGVMSFSFSS